MVFVCHACLSAFQFCRVCSPGRQRAGHQDSGLPLYPVCVCVRAPVAFSSWQPATWPPRSAGVCVCHVCLSAFQFCPVCSPGRQRAGRQDAVVFHNIARLCSSCVFILAASRLAARKWGSSNCAFHVAPIPFDHPGLQ